MVAGLQVEGTFRAHQVPLSDPATHPEHLKMLEDWLRSYRPEELFDGQGRLKAELAELAPKGERRMGANPHANGGMLLRDLRMPDFRDYATTVPNDEWLAPTGRVMEMLSEHQCEGWLEGYLLTGRHGFFNCYEAFIHIVDSMFNQHAKWLKVTAHLLWRRKIASLNYLLDSHVWRQHNNGFTHQYPGFIDHVVNKKAKVVFPQVVPVTVIEGKAACG